MGSSYAAGIRCAALGIVGAAALAAGVLTGHGSHDGFFLAAAGGFAIGIAAAMALADARGASGRAVAAPVAEPRQVRELGAARAAEEPADQGPAVAAVARSTVAAVAHDMSNPLASLRSNLEWLRGALEAGRLTEERAEAREVLRDAHEAAERLRVDVGALRAAGRGDGQAPPA
jgi:signal transduction histidine kinase